MKYFFWLGALAYVFVYFYAAWTYEGFSMTLAIIIFVALLAFLYWRYQRHLVHLENQQAQPQVVKKSAPAKNLSIWSSPLPYMLVLAIFVVYSVLSI